MTKKNNSNVFVFSGLLLALIISANVVRYLLNIYESNIMIYSFYILFIIINVLKKRIFDFNVRRKDLPLIMISLLIMGYSLATGLYYGDNAIYSAFKLIISFLVAFYVIKMSQFEIKYSINSMFAICIIYSLMLLLNPNKRDEYLTSGGNYLNMSLPIGLVLTIFLTRAICSFFFKNSIRYKMTYICISIFLIYTVLIFPSRGAILFPFGVAALIVIVLGRKNFPRFIGMLFAGGIVIFAVSQYFLHTASGYNLQHMLKLFQDIRSEDRIIIWKEYIDYVITHRWFLIGGGANSSITKLGFYPHNLYLQFIGEFGILGITFSVLATGRIIREELITLSEILKKSNFEDDSIVLFFDCASGLLYLFLTFMKSFSIYDACMLMIFCAFTLNVCQACTDRIVNGRKETLNGRNLIKHCNSN